MSALRDQQQPPTKMGAHCMYPLYQNHTCTSLPCLPLGNSPQSYLRGHLPCCNPWGPVLWDYALHSVQADSTRTEFMVQWWLEDTSEGLSISTNQRLGGRSWWDHTEHALGEFTWAPCSYLGPPPTSLPCPPQTGPPWPPAARMSSSHFFLSPSSSATFPTLTPFAPIAPILPAPDQM